MPLGSVRMTCKQRPSADLHRALRRGPLAQVDEAAARAVRVRVGHQGPVTGRALDDRLDPQVRRHRLAHEDGAGDQLSQPLRGRAGRRLHRDGPRTVSVVSAVMTRKAPSIVMARTTESEGRGKMHSPWENIVRPRTADGNPRRIDRRRRRRPAGGRAS